MQVAALKHSHFLKIKIQTQIKRGFPVFLFLIMLLRPQVVFEGACRGLMLWFQVVLPTLYPFLLLSSFLLVTGSLRLISSFLGKLFFRFLRISPNGSFVVLCGFLCGYPVGAKLASDMHRSAYISYQEGCYLLSFCNNASPAFILNFLVLQTLGDTTLMIPSIFILMVSPLIVSIFTRRIYLSAHSSTRHVPVSFSSADDAHHNLASFGSASTARHAQPAPQQTWTFREIDACIMDSFETLLKVGGYIILFSVLLSLLRTENCPVWFSCLLSTLEITNGLQILASLPLSVSVSYPLMLGLTAFGGFCAMAQTQCMVHASGFPMLPYFTQKLAAALTASLFGVLYLNIH